MQIDQSTCFVTLAAPLLHLCTINEMWKSETESGTQVSVPFVTFLHDWLCYTGYKWKYVNQAFKFLLFVYVLK